MPVENALGFLQPKVILKKVELVLNIVDAEGNVSSEAFQMDPQEFHFHQHRPVFHGPDGMLISGEGYLNIHGVTVLLHD